MTATQTPAAHTPGTMIQALVPCLVTSLIDNTRRHSTPETKCEIAQIIRVFKRVAAYGIDNTVIVAFPTTRLGREQGYRARDLLREAVRLVADTPFEIPVTAKLVQRGDTEAVLTW
jgi:hypothetical protein